MRREILCIPDEPTDDRPIPCIRADVHSKREFDTTNGELDDVAVILQSPRSLGEPRVLLRWLSL